MKREIEVKGERGQRMVKKRNRWNREKTRRTHSCRDYKHAHTRIQIVAKRYTFIRSRLTPLLH